MFRVPLNEARSHLRRRRPLRLLEIEGPQVADHTDPLAHAADRIAVFQALGLLSPRQRECVVLVDYLGVGALGRFAETPQFRAGVLRAVLSLALAGAAWWLQSRPNMLARWAVTGALAALILDPEIIAD